MPDTPEPPAPATPAVAPPTPAPAAPGPKVRAWDSSTAPPRERRSASTIQPARLGPQGLDLPDELREAKRQLVSALNFADHVRARSQAATRVDRRLGLENIVGVYIGSKLFAGRPTGEKAVVVEVLQKSGNAKRIDPYYNIPPELRVGDKTYPTDIVQVAGDIKAQGFTGLELPKAHCGASIGREKDGTTGTMACMLIVDNNAYILSNNHVLAAVNQGAQGDFIVQPGPADTAVSNTRRIAVLDGGKIARLNLANFANASVPFSPVDASLALVDYDLVSWTHHTFTIQNLFVAPDDPGLNAVKKEGRTTGLTTGRVTGVDGDHWVSYEGNVFAHFSNMLVIEGNGGLPFSQPGDSGSLIVSGPENIPVALLVTGQGNQTYANPIKDALDFFNVDKFVTKKEDLN